MRSDTRKIKTEKVGKKRRDQLRKRKRLIKDLNSPTFPDSKTEPSREFQPFTQAGTKYLTGPNSRDLQRERTSP